MKKPTLLVAHSHEIYLTGILQSVDTSRFKVIKTTNGITAMRQILKAEPVLAIIGAQLDKISTFEIVKKVSNMVSTKFIVVFHSKEYQNISVARAAGVQGVLHDSDGFKTFKACISKVLNNKFYCSPTFPKTESNEVNQFMAKLGMLSKSEIRLLSMVEKYKTSKAIAIQLGLSQRTIEKHRSNIIKKLHLKKRTNLIQWVLENKNLIKAIA